MEGLEFCVPPAPHRLDKVGIPKRTEEQKGLLFAIFLPHEQQRQVRGEQQQTGCQALGRRAEKGAQTLALRAIANLVMILQAYDKAIPWEAANGGAIAAVAVSAIAPGEHKRLFKQCREILYTSVIAIIALALTGQIGMHRVMKIVAPLRGESIAPAFWWQEQADVIEVTFRHNMERPAQALGDGSGDVLDVAQDMARAGVKDGMHGIQA